ncbi:TY3B-I: Ty3b-i, partial [Crotalus adamanteus]
TLCYQQLCSFLVKEHWRSRPWWTSNWLLPISWTWLLPCSGPFSSSSCDCQSWWRRLMGGPFVPAQWLLQPDPFTCILGCMWKKPCSMWLPFPTFQWCWDWSG